MWNNNYDDRLNIELNRLTDAEKRYLLEELEERQMNIFTPLINALADLVKLLLK